MSQRPRKPVKRHDSSVRQPFMDDSELLALERKEVHIDSARGDDQAFWNNIQGRVDQAMYRKRRVGNRA